MRRLLCALVCVIFVLMAACSFICGALCGDGATLLLQRTGSTWKVVRRCGQWVS